MPLVAVLQQLMQRFSGQTPRPVGPPDGQDLRDGGEHHGASLRRVVALRSVAISNINMLTHSARAQACGYDGPVMRLVVAPSVGGFGSGITATRRGL